jgi:hypothetical protein
VRGFLPFHEGTVLSLQVLLEKLGCVQGEDKRPLNKYAQRQMTGRWYAKAKFEILFPMGDLNKTTRKSKGSLWKGGNDDQEGDQLEWLK